MTKRFFCSAIWLVLLATLVVPAASQQGPLSTAQIAKLATPATVTILTIDARGDTVGLGSGFIITTDGAIVTNYHVMAGATTAVVLLATGERYAQVTGLAGDPDADVAVIKIPAAGLPTLRTRNTLPALGSRVVAVGSPLGLSQTVSDGIVSGRRVIEGRELMQMSAPISPGSSGGPVLNESGEVVAISTSYLAKGQALNFAVPVRYAMGILDPTAQPRSLAEVFPLSLPSASRSEPSEPSPSVRPEDLAAIAQGDSARSLFCGSAFLLDKSRAQMDSLLPHADLSRLRGNTAAVMSAVLEHYLPKAEVHVNRLRLAEVSPSMREAGDRVLSALTYADSVLARAMQRVDYRGDPTLADIRSTASTTLEVATILDREYIRARDGFGRPPSRDPLPACLSGGRSPAPRPPLRASEDTRGWLPGTYVIDGMATITSPQGSNHLHRAGLLFIADVNTGIAAISSFTEGPGLHLLETTIAWLSQADTAPDGPVRVGMAGTSWTGYLTEGHGLLLTAQFVDTSGGPALLVRDTLVATRVVHPSADGITGNYDLKWESNYIVPGYKGPSPTLSWAGRGAVFISIDSVWVAFALRNDSGGSTGFTGAGPLETDGHFRLTAPGGNVVTGWAWARSRQLSPMTFRAQRNDETYFYGPLFVTKK